MSKQIDCCKSWFVVIPLVAKENVQLIQQEEDSMEIIPSEEEYKNCISSDFQIQWNRP